MTRILLHHCCAPCSPKVIEFLQNEFNIESFWFNPNIQPAEEHSLRRDSFLRLVAAHKLQVHYGKPYTQDCWLDNAKNSAERCAFCYSLRLSETARTAKELGIRFFSTTLLSSPYQKHDLIRALGEKAAVETGAEFLYRDFRPYYYEGRNSAYRDGHYMQKYCGCVFSKAEREEKKG